MLSSLVPGGILPIPILSRSRSRSRSRRDRDPDCYVTGIGNGTGYILTGRVRDGISFSISGFPFSSIDKIDYIFTERGQGISTCLKTDVHVHTKLCNGEKEKNSAITIQHSSSLDEALSISTRGFFGVAPDIRLCSWWSSDALLLKDLFSSLDSIGWFLSVNCFNDWRFFRRNISLFSFSAPRRVRWSVTASFEHENNRSTSVLDAGIASIFRTKEWTIGNRSRWLAQYPRTWK